MVYILRNILFLLLLVFSPLSTANEFWLCSYEHVVTKENGEQTSKKIISGMVLGFRFEDNCPALPKDVYRNTSKNEFNSHFGDRGEVDEPSDLSCTHNKLPLRKLDDR